MAPRAQNLGVRSLPSLYLSLTLTLLLGPNRVGHATKRTRLPSRGSAFINCKKFFDDRLASSSFAAPAVSRFADVRLRELGGFRGFEITRSNQPPTHLVELPELRLSAKHWRVEKWEVGDSPYFLYDIGPRNLENDKVRLDILTLAQLQNSNITGAFLKASDRRRRDLRYLAQFERAFARRARQSAKAEAPDRSVIREILKNTDLFGVLDRNLRPSADPRLVADHLVMLAELFYDERRNFVRPSLDGVMREMGFESRVYEPLPYLKRVSATAAERLRHKFESDFGDGSSCELSPLAHFRAGENEELRLRLLLEVYDRVRNRKCQTMVTSMVNNARFIEFYGFRPWRTVKRLDGRREGLFILQINTPDFNTGYARIVKRLQELRK